MPDYIPGTFIPDGSLTTPKYAAGSVTGPVIGSRAVSISKVANDVKALIMGYDGYR